MRQFARVPELYPGHWAIFGKKFSQPFGLTRCSSQMTGASVQANQQLPFLVSGRMRVEVLLQQPDRFCAATALGEQGGSLERRRAQVAGPEQGR
jgi:hypothetical protein